MDRSQHLRKQIKNRLNGCFAAFQPLGDGWLSDEAVVGLGIATIFPLGSRGHQDNTLGCPGSDAQGLEVSIITNHGIWMPTAGMQRSPRDKRKTLDRISSESRLLLAEAVVKSASTPQDLVDGMCQVYINDPQLNILRTSTNGRKMRTTSQQLCVPKEQTLYCRPVSSHMKFDFWSLNRPDTGVWVEIMSNRELWQNVRGDPPFGHMNMQDLE